jgi:hypothetical protein
MRSGAFGLRVSSGSQRHAFIVAAENVHGVKAVRDHLAYVDPMSGMIFGTADKASGE